MPFTIADSRGVATGNGPDAISLSNGDEAAF
jgi:hypothetical protein